jgi:REP element-mobilizing transposase RayT
MELAMNRYWFLTFTTYGSRLPGDRRGFVSNVADALGNPVRHNQLWQPFDQDHPGLRSYAASRMKGPMVLFQKVQAETILAQFQETARYRGWQLLAVAIMPDHVHIVVGVPGDPEPETLLRDFKSYASRSLNEGWGKPKSDTWWTGGGSTRKLKDLTAIREKIEYVRNQPNSLVIWVAEGW